MNTHNIYYQWLLVKSDWMRFCENSVGDQRIIEDFFDPGFLFPEVSGSWSSDELEIMLGTSEQDGKRYILLTRKSIIRIQNYLNPKLKMRESLPFPYNHDYTYCDVQRVQFRNKRDFFRTTDTLKKGNKSVRPPTRTSIRTPMRIPARVPEKPSERLVDMRRIYENAKKALMACRYAFLSLNTGILEHGDTKIVEIGWTILDPCHPSGMRRFLDQHYIIKENHSDHCAPDGKDAFRFGISVVASLSESISELQKDIDLFLDRDGGISLISHDLKTNIERVEKAGIRWLGGHRIQQFDTNIMNSARLGSTCDRIELERTLASLGIENDNRSLRNSGNSSHYVMQLFLKLCSMNTLLREF